MTIVRLSPASARLILGYGPNAFLPITTISAAHAFSHIITDVVISPQLETNHKGRLCKGFTLTFPTNGDAVAFGLRYGEEIAAHPLEGEC